MNDLATSPAPCSVFKSLRGRGRFVRCEMSPWLCLTMLFLMMCAEGSAPDTPDGRARPVENPPTSNLSSDVSISECVAIHLEVDAGGSLSESASFVILNKCRSAIAILTSPLETRYRRSARDAFPYEGSPECPYAILHFVADGVEPIARFVGDGGMSVNGIPEFAEVPAEGTRSLRITHLDRLCTTLGKTSGRIAIATWAVPVAKQSESTGEVIDLAVNVDAFNQRHPSHAQAFILPRTAVQLTTPAVAFDAARCRARHP